MASVRELIEAREATVAIVGVGYVGLPLACHFTDAGFDVVGLDIDTERVERLRNGSSYVDDVSDETLRSATERGFTPTTDASRLGDADVFVIAVPTGFEQGEPEMSAVGKATESIAAHAPDRELLVVCSSTVYPGATDEVIRNALRTGGHTPGEETLVAVVPERINPGGRYEFQDIPLIVGADSDRERRAAQSLFRSVTVGTVPVESTKTAEMAKTLENTYRMVNIALVNELARHAGEIGVDAWEVVDAAATKPFGFQAFYPGPGVGGHCIPIDPQFLTWIGRRNDTTLEMIEGAFTVNDSMPMFVVDQLETAMAARGTPLADASLVVLGATYKPNVSDVRNSPALEICEGLEANGADLDLVDPHLDRAFLNGELFEPTNTIERRTIAAADGVVVLVDHDAFEYESLRDASFVYDAQNAVPEDIPATVLRLGDGKSLGANQERVTSPATSSRTFQS